MTLCQRIGAARPHRQPAVAELGRGRLQRAGMAKLEAHRVVARIAFEVHEGMVAIVAAVVVRAGLDAHQFQANDLARKTVGPDQVAGAEPDVANVEQIDHGRGLRRSRGTGARPI